MTIKAPIVEMLERKIKSEVRQDLKKEMTPFVLRPIHILSVVSIFGLFLSIWQPWSLIIVVISLVCLMIDTIYREKLVISNSGVKQTPPESEIMLEINPTEEQE